MPLRKNTHHYYYHEIIIKVSSLTFSLQLSFLLHISKCTPVQHNIKLNPCNPSPRVHFKWTYIFPNPECNSHHIFPFLLMVQTCLDLHFLQFYRLLILCNLFICTNFQHFYIFRESSLFSIIWYAMRERENNTMIPQDFCFDFLHKKKEKRARKKENKKSCYNVTTFFFWEIFLFHIYLCIRFVHHIAIQRGTLIIPFFLHCRVAVKRKNKSKDRVMVVCAHNNTCRCPGVKSRLFSPVAFFYFMQAVVHAWMRHAFKKKCTILQKWWGFRWLRKEKERKKKLWMNVSAAIFRLLCKLLFSRLPCHSFF